MHTTDKTNKLMTPRNRVRKTRSLKEQKGETCPRKKELFLCNYVKK